MLRPTLFSIPSSTELKVTFNKNLSKTLSIENFSVVSVSGNINDLEVTGVVVADNVVVVTTKPQIAGNYYILKLVDTMASEFSSVDGVALINDDLSRDLYFLGLKNYNPVRDRIIQNVPSLYKLDNSNLTSLIDNQAEELYRAQKHVGQLLSDNYISEPVIDERRIRSSGATDRLANEGAFLVEKVSSKRTGELPIFREVEYNSTSAIPRHSAFPKYPISAKEVAVDSEEISLGTTGASFDGFLINLPKKDIIKLNKLIHIKSDDVVDCDGDLGTEYNISIYKYSILNNRYDSEYGFKNVSLNSNQILLSEFGNIDEPKLGDKIIISYLYKDSGIQINEDSLEIFNLKAIPQESIPANITRFFLKHAPVVDSHNEIPERGGVSFLYGQASTDTPAEFKRELVFDTSKLPSKIGEYAINYSTGEVIVVGSKIIGEGTGSRPIVASYIYRNSFVKNLDFYINNNEIVASETRILVDEEVSIEYTYEKVFAEGVDYEAPCHTEIFNEHVENKFSSSFSISPKNTPITDVFRVFNQTTGEVYQPLYHTDDEIFFAGRRSPEFKESGSEEANFDQVEQEDLVAAGEFVCPAFEIQIRSALSNSNIRFSPGIPSELINLGSQDYFVRSTGLGGTDPVEDIQIRFFGSPDSNGLVNSFGIALSAQAPSLGEDVTLGPLGYVFSLENTQIIGDTEDSIGSFLNSSILFSDESVFLNEKYFKSSTTAPSLKRVASSSIKSTFVASNNDNTLANISRLRKPGDYSVDYDNGKIYLAVSTGQDYESGSIDYKFNSSLTRNSNIIAVSQASKLLAPNDTVYSSVINYDKVINTNNSINIDDLETSLILNRGVSARDLTGILQEVNKVLSDYTVVVEHNISSIKAIIDEKFLEGYGLGSKDPAKRIGEANATSALQTVIDGGKNLYDSSYVSFENNVIDLKKKYRTRVVKDSGATLVRISDVNFASVFKIENISTNKTLSAGDFTVISDSLGAYVSFAPGSIGSDNDIVLVSYLVSGTPTVGTEVAIDYRYGKIYFNYTYSYDDVYISYEYGDNQIDWSIGSAIAEGEEYFVTYKYGALREALRKNFGILTKIPFFQKFGLNIDRELYRNALSGVMQAFTGGPIRSSFNTLIESFTDIEPEITESAFGSWILGRDFLQPEEVSISGPIKFANCKFKEGLEVAEGTVVTTPAISNLNLDEGTISSWVVPYWAGIDNDANITVDIDNIGTKVYKYTLGSDIFSYENNFNLFPDDDRDGGIDTSLPSITIHNSNVVLAGEQEILEIAPNAIVKSEETLTRATRLDLSVSIKIDNFSIPSIILGTAADTPVSAPTDGALGLYESIVNVPWNLIGKSPSQALAGYASPGFISIGDDNKLLFLQLALRPVTDSLGAARTFIIADEDLNLDFNEIPKYDRLHITRSCRCSVTDTVSDLADFRDKDFQSIRITFDAPIDISNISDENVIYIDKPSVFKVTDSRGAIYDVFGFIDAVGSDITTTIPDSISGFILNKIPQNHQEITARGSAFINDYNPQGNMVLSYQVASVLTKENTASAAVLGYKEKSFIVDWSSDYLDVSIVRNPVTNSVIITLSSALTTAKQVITLFYTDLINSADEDYIFSRFNLSSLVDLPVSSDVSLSDKIAIGTLDRACGSVINVNNFSYNLFNRFNLSDIYIGKFAKNPSKLPFVVNKYDSPDTSVGFPFNYDTSEGVFIGFDDLCLSDLSADSGQWIFRTRSREQISLPTSVNVIGSEYSLEFSDIYVNHIFSGRILTDGEFSSVLRSYRKADDSCASGIICSANYRYCGDGLIESSGWRRINETDSGIINPLLGGSENDIGFWDKSGNFNTAIPGGIYRAGPSTSAIDPDNRDSINRNSLFSRLPCSEGDWTATIDFRVLETDSGIISSDIANFNGVISGGLTGISPLHVFDGEVNIKLSLGVSNAGQPVLLVLDGESGGILDILFFDYRDGNFKELIIRKQDGIITVETDTEILSSIALSDFEEASANLSSLLSEPFIAVHLFDGELMSSASYHNLFSGNLIDISLIEYDGREEVGSGLLEADDIFVSTDSKIEFAFNTTNSGVDGYADGYADGYVSSAVYDIDEITFTSDRLRYLFDTGESGSKNRISIFKDGKGFLNFRIHDNSIERHGEGRTYNIATSIKHFKPNIARHIAASWKLNTLYEKDEMHLFIDGLEAPSLFRFGGHVKTRVNDKFSDVSKEMLQGLVEDNIVYYDSYTDGTILAGSSVFSSESLNFSGNALFGRSIIFEAAVLAGIYVGGNFLIGPVVGSGVTILDAQTLDPVIFNTSDSQITFTLAPTAGITSQILTDVKNGSYAIFKTNSQNVSEEFSGIEYTIVNDKIVVTNGSRVIKPQFRVNLDTRLIQFVGEDSDCNMVASVEFSDLDIHIKTFGLSFSKVKKDIVLSSSSYSQMRGPGFESILLSYGVEPVSLSDVMITKVIKPRYIPALDSITDIGDFYLGTFLTKLSDPTGQYKLSSQSTQVARENRGRLLSVNIDSDNISFCTDIVDGYVSSDISSVTIFGDTADGSDFETFLISGNGIINGSKIFYSVDSARGSLILADPDYEPCVLEILESDPITVQNNQGIYAEINRWISGALAFNIFGSDDPFELNPGSYRIEYPAYLNINIPQVGQSIYLGTDLFGKNPFNGIIDEYKIVTEMSSDTRPTESLTSGTRSITEEYLDPNPSCPDDQTLLLVHFDDPIKLQSRKLRQKEFLNTDRNYKFKLDLEDREALLLAVNDRELFESKMIRMGFSVDQATRTFFECHKAQGGPVFNEAKLLRSDKMLISSNSVNDNFGQSAKFFNTTPLVIQNDLSYFRKEGGSIEFWISPLIDTIRDPDERSFVEISSATRKRIKSDSSTELSLPSSARKIISIKLLENKKEFSEFYSRSEIDEILFDEIYRSEITGKLAGGTGVQKDFSLGAELGADGRSISLREALPGSNVDVVVTYSPLDLGNNVISIFKGDRDRLIFGIFGPDNEHMIGAEIDWKRNSWHRVRCDYRANSNNDMMRLLVDGIEVAGLFYGENGKTLGLTSVGEDPGGEGPGGETLSSGEQNSEFRARNIRLLDDFSTITIGGSSIIQRTALSRMDNIRFSRTAREDAKDPSGLSIDLDYSSNLQTVLPVIQDNITTLLLDFSSDEAEAKYASIVDQSSGIFNFDIDVIDSFGKITEDDVEDLIIKLVNILKPSHTNALVRFPRESC